MTNEKLNELIGYIEPVDLSFLEPHESEIYTWYRRELVTAISADGVTEVGSGACDLNREKVHRLRLNGLKLSEIAGQIGIPQGQVEIYCQQLGLPLEGSCRICLDGVEMENPREQKCLNCGMPLPVRRRRFCCNSCMEAYRYQKRKKKLAHYKNEQTAPQQGNRGDSAPIFAPKQFSLQEGGTRETEYDQNALKRRRLP